MKALGLALCIGVQPYYLFISKVAKAFGSSLISLACYKGFGSEKNGIWICIWVCEKWGCVWVSEGAVLLGQLIGDKMLLF